MKKFIDLYNEIISTADFNKIKLKKSNLKSEKYKTNLRKVLQTFFKEPGDLVPKRNILLTLKGEAKGLSSKDKEIIRYLNNNGYLTTPESYEIGLTTNKKGAQLSILEVLKMIKVLDQKKLKEQLSNIPNEAAKNAVNLKIKQREEFKENYYIYFRNIDQKNRKVIVLTWVPRKIASQSTSVGWTSCMNLFDGVNKSYVFPSIEDGQFIAWLVKKGDENKLDNPQARLLIKVYDDKKGNNFWWPQGKIYGTADNSFRKTVEDFLKEKQKAIMPNIDIDSLNLKGKQYDDDDSEINDNAFGDLIIQKLNKKEKYTYKDFMQAARIGSVSLIKKMLKDKNANKIINNGEAIIDASENGHVDVVRELLKDKRVNPSIYNNQAIRYASQDGHIGVVKELLKDKRVDPGSSDNQAIILASRDGNVDIVKELLKDKRVNPGAQSNRVIINASENGHLGIVKELLKDKRVNPAAKNNDAIVYASENGHLGVVKELLKDKRVNPSAQNNVAIKLARENGHLDVVKELLKDKRVKEKLNKK